jgi:hypothetical protein
MSVTVVADAADNATRDAQFLSYQESWIESVEMGWGISGQLSGLIGSRLCYLLGR